MRIEREEKRRLKKLFVGILVMALLVTMLPYDGAGRFVAKAEDTEVFDWTEYMENAITEDIANAEEFTNFFENLDMSKYQDGVILNLTGDIALETMEIQIPSGMIGINLNDKDLSFGSLLFEKAEFVELIIYGEKGSVFGGCYYDETSTEPDDSYIYVDSESISMMIMGDVDISNDVFEVTNRANMWINDLDLSLSESETIIKRYYKEGSISYRDEEFYDEYEELYKTKRYYEYLGENNFRGVDASGNLTTEIHFDIEPYIPGSSETYEEVVFEEDVIPEDVPILYNDTLYAHSNAENELRGNHDYGVHHIVNGTELVIDIAESSDYVRCTEVSTEVDTGTGTETTTEIMGVAVIDAYFARYVEENDGYTKITYAEGSIPQSFVSYNDANTYDVEVIQLNDEGEASISESGSPYNLEFHFEIESGRELDIINNTTFVVTATNDVPVWVPWVGIFELGEEEPEGNTESNIKEYVEEGALRYEETENPDEVTEQQYIKAGSKITLEPNTDMYIYGMYWGEHILANSKYFEYCTNGNINVTVPAFAITDGLSLYTGKVMDFGSVNLSNIEESVIEVVTGSKYSEANEEIGEISWFDSAIEIKGNRVVQVTDEGETIGHQYIICEESDALTANKEWSRESLMLNEEGSVTKTFYVMDVFEEIDSNDYDYDGDTTEYIPSDNYGARGVVTYTYVLDTASPIITGITAEDAKGNALKLNGGWYANGTAAPQPQTVWTSQPSVTVTATADVGKGLSLSDTAYKFEGDWQKDASYTYSGDGVHAIEILVRDKFDEATERGTAGIWLSSVGIDTTAPTLLFTDAKNPTQSALKSDSTYEGNLHVVGDDANGSGFASINLEKKDGENWVAANELLVKTETGYYIAPTTQNDVYRIVITDAVGNTATYENVTVAGYTQDVALAVGSMTATYGNELSIPVTITNTSDNSLQIALFALREDATASVFDKEIGTVTELAAGKTFTTTVKIPEGVDAGNYNAMLDIQYTNAGGSLETTIEKAYSYQIQATIEKAKGVGSVSIADFYYGETKAPVATSSTNGNESVTIYYKESAQDDSYYAKVQPREVGSYYVKAVFPATTNYEEVVAQSTFTISRMKADANMYVVETKADDSGIYKTDVVIKGQNGNLLCTSEDGEFTEKLTITESTDNYVFYVKTTTGAITEKVELGKIVIDKSVQEDTEQPEDTEEPEDSQEPEKNDPIDVTEGKVRLEKGKAYTFGKGSWSVKGDNTSYAGGITFYVPKSGNYEFSQE